MKMPTPPAFLSRSRIVNMQLMKLHIHLYELTKGKIGSSIMGTPMLLLYTKGRKSGEPRKTPLLYMCDGDRFVIIASAGGSPKHPAWYLNLKAHETSRIRAGGKLLTVKSYDASGDERTRLWSQIIEVYSGYSDYQKRTDREIPVVVLEPAS